MSTFKQLREEYVDQFLVQQTFCEHFKALVKKLKAVGKSTLFQRNFWGTQFWLKQVGLWNNLEDFWEQKYTCYP